MALVVQEAEDAVTMQDLKGEITFLNRSGEKMYGYSEEEAIGMNFHAIIPEDIVGQMTAAVKDIYKGKKVAPIKTKRNRKGGKVINVSSTIKVLTNTLGEINGIVTMERVITDR